MDESGALTDLSLGETPTIEPSTEGARQVAEEAIRAFLTVKGPASQYQEYENAQGDAYVAYSPTRYGSPGDDGNHLVIDQVAGTKDCPDNAAAQLFGLVGPDATKVKSLKLQETDPVASVAPSLDEAGFAAVANVQGTYDCAGGGLGDRTETKLDSEIDLRISLTRVPGGAWKVARFSARNMPLGYKETFFGAYADNTYYNVAEWLPLIGPADRDVEPEPWVEHGVMSAGIADSPDQAMEAAAVWNRWLSAKGDPEAAEEVCADAISRRLTAKHGVDGCVEALTEMTPTAAPEVIGANMVIEGKKAFVYDDYSDDWLVREGSGWKVDSDGAD